MPSHAPADQVIDGADRRCITLLIELRRHLAAQPAGSIVHLIATDPAAPLDLPAWCHLTGHQYLGALPEQSRPTYAIRVTGNARDTRENRPWATT
jgi:tRNA 2-thiouridine synthesizing protein A